MIRNIILTCATVIVGIASFLSVGERATRADLTYVNSADIHTLDPARMSWTPDFRVALNIWEGLTVIDPRTSQPVEGAALFPPGLSSDGLKYTFTIRKDARWSNGDPVHAADFVRGWRRAMEPGTAADYMVLFTDHIDGAAEYVKWRLENVSVIAGLSRLAHGWEVAPEQVRAIAEHPVFDDIKRLSKGSVQPLADNSKQARQLLAKQMNACDISWKPLHERAFNTHAAQLDARFSSVGITAGDQRTLIVELTQPCPYFLDLTAFPTLLPCHDSIELLREGRRDVPLTDEGLVVYDPQWTKPDWHRNGYPGLVTNGPYRLVEWEFKRRARLAVNPYFREAEKITCRTVDMVVHGQLSSALLAYEAGDVDFLPSMNVPYDHEIARLARSGERPDFHLCDVFATYFFNFNCASTEVGGRANPFLDARVRRAFALAIDKDALVGRVLQRGDRIARTFIPPGAISGYRSPEGLPRDTREALRLLAEVGYSRGRSLPPVDMLCVASDMRVCQAVAAMWETELGAHVELRFKESKTFAADKADLRYMIARGNWYGDYTDPTTFLDCLVSSNGNNDSGYSSPRYDALVARGRKSQDESQRNALFTEAERILVEEDFPILPILHYSEPIAIKPYVTGLYPNPRLWFPFKNVTVER